MNQIANKQESKGNTPVSRISASEFEQLVHQALVVFTKVSNSDFEQKISTFMEHLRKLMKVDNCYFFEYAQGTGRASMSYKSVSETAAMFLGKTDFQEIPLFDIFPEVAKKLIDGRPLIIRTEKDLRAFSDTFRQMILNLSVKSLLYVPVKTGDRFYGAFGFDHLSDYIQWSTSTIARLQLLGNILANVLDRSSKAKSISQLESELFDLKKIFGKHSRHHDFDNESVDLSRPIVGNSPKMRQFNGILHTVALSNHPTHIVGELGTGKDFYAKRIHEIRSPDGGFLKINCAMIQKGTLGDRIIVKSARNSEYKWVNEYGLSEGGTMLFNHVSNLEPDHFKLLRSLINYLANQKICIKVITTTDNHLEHKYESGQIDREVYYALTHATLIVPPLRERTEDISDFARYFANRIAATAGIPNVHISDRSIDLLQEYSWPGNLMELRNVIEGTIISSGSGLIEPAKLKAHINVVRGDHSKSEGLDDVVKAHVLNVVERCRWKIEGPGGASEILKLNPSTLRSKMRKLGIKK